jgi:protein CpxP
MLLPLIILSRYRKHIDMTTTSKFHWLVTAVTMLAVVNLVFLGYIWLQKKDGTKEIQQPKDARNYLVKKLKLNAHQQQQFDSLRKGHFEQMKKDREEMKKLKDAFFGQLKNGDGKDGKGIAQQIGSLQARIDLNTFSHFAALRNICTTGQREKFDDIIEDVLRNMGRGPGPPGGGRPGPPPGEGPPPGGGPPLPPGHGEQQLPPTKK